MENVNKIEWKEFVEDSTSDSPSYMRVGFRCGDGTSFGIIEEYGGSSASLRLSHNELRKLGIAIVERLKTTPYKITIE